MSTTRVTDAMATMLKRLDAQAAAATAYPGAYSPDLWIGTRYVPTSTCEALIRRGLATEGSNRHGFRTIAISAAGRAAIGA